MVDAHVLSDLCDLVGDVPDRHGGESSERESHFQHDQANNRVDRLGQGGDRPRFSVLDCGSVDSLLDLPADGEEQPRRAEIGEGEVGEDGTNVEE